MQGSRPHREAGAGDTYLFYLHPQNVSSFTSPRPLAILDLTTNIFTGVLPEKTDFHGACGP
ncbi:hypothetical protein DXA36_17035 [Eisenbergiella sp. OF01-20]|nr:hypothetical protein DXA36_17035 [Eisenbergiella sp. OF01-20]